MPFRLHSIFSVNKIIFLLFKDLHNLFVGKSLYFKTFTPVELLYSLSTNPWALCLEDFLTLFLVPQVAHFLYLSKHHSFFKFQRLPIEKPAIPVDNDISLIWCVKIDVLFTCYFPLIIYYQFGISRICFLRPASEKKIGCKWKKLSQGIIWDENSASLKAPGQIYCVKHTAEFISFLGEWDWFS